MYCIVVNSILSSGVMPESKVGSLEELGRYIKANQSKLNRLVNKGNHPGLQGDWGPYHYPETLEEMRTKTLAEMKLNEEELSELNAMLVRG